MNNKNEQHGLLQIRSIAPSIIHRFKVYAVTHHQTHAQVFTEAFLLLSKKRGKEKEKREEKEVNVATDRSGQMR